MKKFLVTLLLAAIPLCAVEAQEPAAAKVQANLVNDANVIFINVLGEVNKPSRFALPAGSTILDAVASAGGFAKNGNPSKVRLLHKTAAKEPDVTAVDVRQILNGKAKDVVLRDGDTVFVMEAVF